MSAPASPTANAATHTYDVYWNGGLAYTVEDYSEEKKVRVFNEDMSTFFSYDHFYAGKDDYGAYPYEESPVGNTCLLVKGEKYVFIGEKIVLFSLKPNDSFVQFCSYLGNSGVPYAYLIGSQYVYYFTADKATVVALPIQRVFPTKDYLQDPYEPLYEEDGDSVEVRSRTLNFRP